MVFPASFTNMLLACGLTIAGWGVAELRKLGAAHIKNTHLRTIGNLAAQVAGGVISTLQTLPEGSNAGVVKAAAIAAGVRQIKGIVPEALSSVGVDDEALATMIEGEIGKLAVRAA